MSSRKPCDAVKVGSILFKTIPDIRNLLCPTADFLEYFRKDKPLRTKENLERGFETASNFGFPAPQNLGIPCQADGVQVWTSFQAAVGCQRIARLIPTAKPPKVRCPVPDSGQSRSITVCNFSRTSRATGSKSSFSTALMEAMGSTAATSTPPSTCCTMTLQGSMAPILSSAESA